VTDNANRFILQDRAQRFHQRIGQGGEIDGHGLDEEFPPRGPMAQREVPDLLIDGDGHPDNFIANHALLCRHHFDGKDVCGMERFHHGREVLHRLDDSEFDRHVRQPLRPGHPVHQCIEFELRVDLDQRVSVHRAHLKRFEIEVDR
jgi:hypothetical protein